MGTQIEALAVFYFVQSFRDVVIAGQHAERLSVSDDLHVRILLAQQADASRMVRLHVTDNEIIECTPV